MQSLQLTKDFMSAIKRGNPHKMQEALDGGYPVNYQDPITGATILHILAAGGARKALRVLLKSNQIDFKLRDNQGRLASEMAFRFSRDIAVGRLLAKKERKQFHDSGELYTHRPLPKIKL